MQIGPAKQFPNKQGTRTQNEREKRINDAFRCYYRSSRRSTRAAAEVKLEARWFELISDSVNVN